MNCKSGVVPSKYVYIFKMKIIHILLLSFFLFGLLSSCAEPEGVDISKEPLSPPDRVDVVYFYDSEICHCQIAPGERIQSDLFINFSGELAIGKLTYQAIDLATDNTTMAAKYGATSQSLFVNIVRAGKEQIIAMPELLLVKDDSEAIDRLINNRIREYLDGTE
jgi:hypothetical protein